VELFERAVANLIDNALRFTDKGGEVVLGLGLAGQDPAQPDRVEVSVRDNGCGMASADMEHLFDRMYQRRDGVTPASAEGGKGLGLAIVKRIVELHRGTVRARSAPAQGTEVTMSLPRATV
jgi:signal transduction histidine kinase